MAPHAVTVGVISREPIVEAGVRGLLAAYPERIGFAAPVAGVDVVLYDVLGLHEGPDRRLTVAVARHPGRVLALARAWQPHLSARALGEGAVACVAPEVDGPTLLRTIEATAAGHFADGSPIDLANQRLRRRQLGLDLELSPRESEVLELVVLGRANAEIAEELFLSINTVKSVIRGAYAKIGAVTRPQAVAWGIEHGFAAHAAAPVD